MPGEIAEMMLDGTLCECCGEYIGDGDSGYPRYCSEQCARDRGAITEQVTEKIRKDDITGQPIAKKLVKRLKALSQSGTADGPMTPAKGEAMYAGEPWELASAQYERLAKRGYVERRSPHNMAHKDRAVITPAGLKFLERRKI